MAEGEKLSELDVASELVVARARQYLKDSLEKRRKIQEELSRENLSEKKKMDLEEAYKTIGENIQKLRFSGILDQ
jgi:hypothetical protein